MYCHECGKEISDQAKFCTFCGTVMNTGSSNSNAEQSFNNSANSNYYNNSYNSNNVSQSTGFDAKTTSIVGYMTWIGFIIAYCAGDREGAKFYLNQALVFNLFGLICVVPFLGWLWSIFMLICFILGVIWAAEQTPRELPLIGMIHIID